ncbi:MAG: hypothetical protein P8R37_09055 [Opitutae bacterium]|nr:hypothetical protein [Opitutae bacterium]
MKNKITLSTLLLLMCTFKLQALNIQWQTELPLGTQIDFSVAGINGSAVAFDSDSDTLYWIGTDGNMLATIPNFTNNPSESADTPLLVSDTILIIPIFSDFDGVATKIITKTDSSYSIETISGVPHQDEALQTSFPFFLVENGLLLTQYRIPSSSTPQTTSVTMVPANAVVIPAAHQGNVTIELQSSADLVEWISVLPGSYSPTNEARFFRVKATTEN